MFFKANQWLDPEYTEVEWAQCLSSLRSSDEPPTRAFSVFREVFLLSLSVQRFEDRGVSLVNVVVKVDQSLIINLSRPVEDKNWQRF